MLRQSRRPITADSSRPCRLFSRSPYGSANAPDILEAHVLDGVGLPVAIVEMPPLELVNRKTLCFHVPLQKVAQAALLPGSARVARIRPLGRPVVEARHAHRATRLEVVGGEIHGAAAIVTGACRWMGAGCVQLNRHRIPDY